MTGPIPVEAADSPVWAADAMMAAAVGLWVLAVFCLLRLHAAASRRAGIGSRLDWCLTAVFTMLFAGLASVDASRMFSPSAPTTLNYDYLVLAGVWVTAVSCRLLLPGGRRQLPRPDQAVPA